MQVLGGIHLPGCGLWLDPSRKRPLAVVTHAHSDHALWHHETLTTPATAALMRARLGNTRGRVREVGYGSPHRFPGGTLTLLPAGHILGSAQALVETGEGSLLYTGDFKLRPGLTSEAATVVRADTLILETTFGRPDYRFPPFEAVREAIIAFCRRALEEGVTPVLLAYSLGKGQEVLAALAGSGLPVALHPAVARITRVYESFGVGFPPYTVHGPGDSGGGTVLLYPPGATLPPLPRQRRAIVSGWALNPRARYQYRCDDAFPLSDHADYDELLRHVEAVNPRRVYTVHGFTEEFACDLRRRGIEAWALGGQNQLELRFA